jgi:20S proteasome subunit beta 6
MLVVAAVSVSVCKASNFEPYEMNGGLVAAVAGRDWTILAADTRLTGGGYSILHRSHVSSRLWVATETPESSTLSSWISPDGSISLATPNEYDKTAKPNTNGNVVDSSVVSTTLLTQAPILIGSAGCQTDCEMLKRLVRADLRTAHYFSESGIAPDQVATLLSQMLYSRRGFPFYSFCVVAGLSDNEQSELAGGQVFVYDAVGSYEQVAVATSGTGRELLQPILDRQFRTLLSPIAEDNGDERVTSTNGLVYRPVPGCVPSTQVDCSKEQAVSILADAYRSVSEREIGVGDQVVFCVLQRKPDGRVESQIIRYPLKKH